MRVTCDARRCCGYLQCLNFLLSGAFRAKFGGAIASLRFTLAGVTCLWKRRWRRPRPLQRVRDGVGNGVGGGDGGDDCDCDDDDADDLIMMTMIVNVKIMAMLGM